MIDRIVFFAFITLLAVATWITFSLVDNHEKWDNCSMGPHEFESSGEYITKKWGKGFLNTCRNCGFQYVQLLEVSTNGETANVMAIKSVFSHDFDECYIEYGEPYSIPKHIRVKDENIKPLRTFNINGN